MKDCAELKVMPFIAILVLVLVEPTNNEPLLVAVNTSLPPKSVQFKITGPDHKPEITVNVTLVASDMSCHTKDSPALRFMAKSLLDVSANATPTLHTKEVSKASSKMAEYNLRLVTYYSASDKFYYEPYHKQTVDCP